MLSGGQVALAAARKPDWGDVPTWAGAGVAALGLTVSILALYFAAKAALAARDIYKIESARDRLSENDRAAREEEAEKEQAAKVACWLEPSGQKVRIAGSDTSRFLILLRNASDLPVYDLIAYYCYPDGDAYKVVDEYVRPVLAPDATDKIDPPTKLLYKVGTEAMARGRAALTFRDAGGRSWWRHPDGRLERREDDVLPWAVSPLSAKKVYLIPLGAPPGYVPGPDDELA
ncbi:hypothetical protein [Actinoplanes sp. NPDC023714]|uniref:hypothetical protein n=1 Tax=Actinoplanes sp. NPDC023714 TaxID=3154322 RepID=UPI003411CBAE